MNILSPELSEKADLPDGAVTREDLAAWDAEFNDICARTGPLFYRTDSRAHAVRYLRGLLAPLERKNGWTIAEYAGLDEPKALQRFLNLTPWDPNGFQAMLGSIELAGEPVAISYRSQGIAQHQITTEIALCRLVRDVQMERRLRYGAAITDRYTYGYDDDDWHDKMASTIISIIIGRDPGSHLKSRPTERRSMKSNPSQNS